MSDSIDKLQIDIKADADSADNSLKSLAESLTNVKTAAKGGVGNLSKVSENIGLLANSANKINASSSSKLNSLVSSVQKLQTLANVKISATLPNNLDKLSASVNNITFSSSDKLDELVKSLRPLSELGKSNLNTYINQLSKLGDVANKLDDSDIDKFTVQMKELATAMAPFANEMNKVAAGFSAFPAKIQSAISSTERYNNSAKEMTASNTMLGGSFTDMAAKIGIAYYAIRQVVDVIGGFITESNEYQENLNLFTASMGQYTEEMMSYANQVSQIMGIDVSDWIRSQGVFMTMTTGFGVASDSAALMSKNLTQLGYDISSFYNIDVNEAMKKLQSGISGELEPLRQLGYDLSEARLQQEALNLGIVGSVSAMTQADKAMLRYSAIMGQVTQAQGDLSRTLDAPANQLRILQAQFQLAARAIGDAFIPMLIQIIPYAIAVLKVITEVANAIAEFFGFEITPIDYSGMSAGMVDASVGASDIEDSLGGATEQAEELKKTLLGIDEINILGSQNTETSGVSTGDIGDVGGASGFDFDLPTYDFIGDAVASNVDELVERMKSGLSDILPIVTAIGTAFASWKIAQGLIKALDYIKGLKGFNLSFGSIGLLGLLSDMNEFMEYFRDFQANGATFENVTGMISQFVGMVGDSLILLGSYKLGGALKVVQGVGEIVIAVDSIARTGVNWDNATTAIRGLSNVGIGIGVMTGNLKVAGWSVAIQGFTGIIGEISENWETIKQGDWSGVDKATLVIGALQVFGGIAVALDAFSKLKGVVGASKAATAMTTVSTTVTDVSTTVGGKLSPSLTSLAKNLGLGIVIIAEVAVAAGLIVGAIWGLGLMLEQVGIAWQPVIDNGGTVLTALGLGTGLLLLVGAATAGLGTLGTALIAPMGIGIGMLALLGVSAALFIAEIWAIGFGLNQIGIAWKPVIDNGETIAKGIGIGTGLLIGIGVVTAALGAATVASAGSLPIAIGLGTAMLVALTAAALLFIAELVLVANALVDDLAPPLERLNNSLPKTSDNMESFTKFMGDFAIHAIAFAGNSAISGLGSTIDNIVDFFTADPIESLAKDVKKTYDQTKNLNEKLNLAIPELKTATKLMEGYGEGLEYLEQLMNIDFGLEKAVLVNMKDVGENIILGLVDGIQSRSSEYKSEANNLARSLEDSFNQYNYRSVGEGIINSMWDGLRSVWNQMNSWWSGLQLAQKHFRMPHFSWTQDPVHSSWHQYGVYFQPRMQVQWYANGGFPSMGEMFIAREAGPEMVGKMGSKTSVANNDQIAQGFASAIKPAIIEAFLTAMSVSGGGESEPVNEISLVVDSETMWKIVQKGKKKSDGRYHVQASMG